MVSRTYRHASHLPQLDSGKDEMVNARAIDFTAVDEESEYVVVPVGRLA